jgi:hypothetical protein
MPVRIQRKRSKGWKMPPNTVYVGRPTKWGNPFTVGSPLCETPEKAVRAYEYNLAVILEGWDVSELRGKNLACWCRLDQACHADVLLRLANESSA